MKKMTGKEESLSLRRVVWLFYKNHKENKKTDRRVSVDVSPLVLLTMLL